MVYQVIQEVIPFAVLASVAATAWKASRKFTTLDIKLVEVVKNTEKCEVALNHLGERVSGIEGELKRMNGGE